MDLQETGQKQVQRGSTHLAKLDLKLTHIDNMTKATNMQAIGNASCG